MSDPIEEQPVTIVDVELTARLREAKSDHFEWEVYIPKPIEESVSWIGRGDTVEEAFSRAIETAEEGRQEYLDHQEKLSDARSRFRDLSAGQRSETRGEP